jgi:uncharacterized repeat protein (TIGR01451 family)
MAAAPALAQSGVAQSNQPVLSLGHAVVTGFSGTVAPGPNVRVPANKSATDLTFIDPDGASARIFDIGKPGHVWDGSVFAAPKTLDVPARDVGQVFGIALDDAPQPNIYLAATSAFGLNLVARARDGQPERRKKGGPGVGWMKGQFGLDLQGSPGAIYKIDGRTGAASLFANVTLDGVPNPGPALGNLAYDAAHRQLFVSDLYSGMIHRFDLDGRELGRYDHGGAGLTAAKLPPVPFNPANRPNIGNAAFDSERPETWGYAPASRRVWGLAVNDNRLYYSIASGPQIWSVGITRDGGFANDPHWELDVPAQAGPLPISDIAFSNKGAMILAQRALVAASYDYSAFTRPGEPQVFRVWLKGPQDPPSPGRWKMVPEEYAVGFAGNHRNTNGGVALGYGYDASGASASNACEFSLWTTGQNLRNAPALKDRLDPGGPLVVHGVQGLPASPVRDTNTPPWLSYSVPFADEPSDPRAAGHMGSIRIYTRPCAAPAAVYGGPGYVAIPPFIVVSLPPECTGPNCINLAVKKTAGNATFDLATGRWTIAFNIDVSNAGNAFAPGSAITISDPVPPGLTFVSATGTNWSCAVTAGTLNCGYAFGTGSFANGAPLNQLVVTYTTNKPGKVENCATVGTAPGSGFQETSQSDNRACASVEVNYPPNVVTIAKVSPTIPCAVDSFCIFQIVVTNSSPWPYTGVVALGDNSSIPMSIASTDLPCSPVPTAMPFTCNASISLPAGISSQTFTVMGIIAAGSIPTAEVPATNCAVITQAPPITGFPSTIVLPPGPDCKSYTACGFACHLNQYEIDQIKIEKKADATQCSPGGLCSYTFTISNMSTTSATTSMPIAFIDAMPAGATTFVPPPTPAPWTCIPVGGSPDNVKCLHPPTSIPAGGQLTVTVSFQIAPGYNQPTLQNCSEFFIGQTSLAALKKRTQNTMDATAMRSYLKSRGMLAMPPVPDPVLNPDDKSCTTVNIVQPQGLRVVPACLPPLIAGPVPGQCICPSGTVLRGKECVKIETACKAPRVNVPGVGCACPQGTVQKGEECVKAPPPSPVCLPPMIPGAILGQCICPNGQTLRAGKCIEVRRPKPEQACPNGAPRRNGECVERERKRPAIEPGDVIRVLPGLIGPGGGGGTRGGGGESGGGKSPGVR